MNKNPEQAVDSVVFRKWNKSQGGGIIALFPALPYDRAGTLVTSFENVGQHGGADYSGVIAASTPATKEEYHALKKELEGAQYGYVLKVVSRRPSRNSSRARIAM